MLLLLLAALSHPYLTDRSRVVAAVRRQPALAIVPVVVLVAALALSITAESKCIKESNYFCIDVGPDATGQYQELRLDLLIHGIVNPQNPAELIYPYEKLYQQVTESAFQKGGPITAFQIGGGTYSFPRYLAANYDARISGRRDRPGGDGGRALAPRACATRRRSRSSTRTHASS